MTCCTEKPASTYRPFDLASAKAGNKMMYCSNSLYVNDDPKWKPCHFVGISLSGNIVIEGDRTNIFDTMPEKFLRMAPIKITIWRVIYADAPDYKPKFYDWGYRDEAESFANTRKPSNVIGPFCVEVEAI